MPERPAPESYWVSPGFLAGKYPGSPFAENTRAYLEKLRIAGICAFVDLTEPDELKTYQPELAQLAEANSWAIAYHRQPIADQNVPTVAQMVTILDLLDRLLTVGPPLYLHCHAGVNRTGTVVGCWLARHGTIGEAALAELAKLRTGTISYQMGIVLPTHKKQQTMIVNWPVGL